MEAPLAYDAIWALSIALDKSIEKLKEVGRTLEDFNYEDNVTKNVILSNLNDTYFEGVSVSKASID